MVLDLQLDVFGLVTRIYLAEKIARQEVPGIGETIQLKKQVVHTRWDPEHRIAYRVQEHRMGSSMLQRLGRGCSSS
jgi:hypothetical protein